MEHIKIWLPYNWKAKNAYSNVELALKQLVASKLPRIAKCTGVCRVCKTTLKSASRRRRKW
jgi:hypothetical protein